MRVPWAVAGKLSMMPDLLLPAPSGQQLGDPDEDVDRVHVDADAGVDRVEGRGTVVVGVPLSLVDNLLGVVQQEGAELQN